MKRNLNLFIASLVCLVLIQTRSFASSHREAPLIAFDPLADNTDLYAFRSPTDTNKVVIIANYIPFELPQGGPNFYTFGENIRYEIHIKNQSATSTDDIVYRFTFTQVHEDPTTFFRVRLGKENLKTTYTLERSVSSVNGGAFVTIVSGGPVAPPNIGPRSIENTTLGVNSAANTTYGGQAPNYDSIMFRSIRTASSGERVYAGPIDDPFFVDLGGAFDIGNFRTTGRDGLAKFNCHSLIIEVPITTLQKAGKNTTQAVNILDPDFVIGVFATASRREITTFDTSTAKETPGGNFIQVSRLGMPLTNEVIIPVGMKDKWNSVTTNTSGETQFGNFFRNPELANYMDDSKYGSAVPGLAALRVQTSSLGTYDFRNYKQGLFPLKNSPALDNTALSEANYGGLLLPDNHSPRAVDILPIFLTGVPNLRPYQLATGKPANTPLATGKPFINNFLPTVGDMLRLNMAVPVTPRTISGSPNPDFSSLGLIKAAVLGLTDSRYTASGTALQFIPNMDGFPNGRRLEDDVVTISLQAVGGVVLAAIGLPYEDPNRLTQTLNFNGGVTKNDTTLKDRFPFVQAPWRGFIGASYSGPQSTQILPVTFVDFTAAKSGKKVLLQWKVTNEVNNDRYVVERSIDGKPYVKIGTVPAASGTTNNYELFDGAPYLDRVNLYRITQIDKDGHMGYSGIRAVRFDEISAISISPNPASSSIRVYAPQKDLQVYLFDQSGKRLMVKQLNNGFVELNIASLPKGVYTVVAENNGVRVESTKIVKQ